MRFLVDTNVLPRLAERSHPQHAVSVDALKRLERLAHELIIVPQVLYEFWSVTTRPVANNGLGLNRVVAHSELVRLQQLFRLARDERAVYAI